MRIGFCLFKYFPFGGLQRDFLRIAQECAGRGHSIRVYTLSWQGEQPAGFEIVVVPVKALSNHRRYEKFAQWVRADCQQRPLDRLVGFNKMPGLDVYYCADPCFEDKAQQLRSRFYRLTPRYRHFAKFERAVFSPETGTEILLLSRLQQPLFMQHYQTPEARFHLLPPGISEDRRRPTAADFLRTQFRQKMGIASDDYLLIQIGSGFRTKGLDRSLRALAALPDDVRQKTWLFAVGQDNPAPFRALAKELAIAERVTIFAGRDDVPAFLLGADVMVHPAYNENTGTVLIEAIVAGLPVLTTDVCGYAGHVAQAQAGVVLPSPFDQSAMNARLLQMLVDAPARHTWSENGLRYAQSADIYRLPQKAADIICDHD